jgi:hypothetical protein
MHLRLLGIDEKTCTVCGAAFDKSAFPGESPKAFAKRVRCSRACLDLGDSPEYRFWKFVDKGDGEDACWEWTGFRDSEGYGTFKAPGIKRASHFAFILANGSVPEDRYVLHRCDNPPCVRPDHLFAGTAKDNYEDARSKGRHTHGERHGGRKYDDATFKKVREALRQIPRQRGSALTVARWAGVPVSFVYDVRYGKRR